MKRIFMLFIVGLLMRPVAGNAQSFTVVADTVWSTITSTGDPSDNITNKTGSNITMKWHVIATDFPADWLAAAAFGICDASTCYNNISNSLWNSSTNVGGVINCVYYANATHDSMDKFNLSMNLYSATSTGTHYVKVNLLDPATSSSKDIVFVVTKSTPSNIQNTTNIVDNIKLYPNPASNELNVVYDANADVKNIAVYNIIGKMMSIYKVNGPSANLNIENMPAGIYFVRLYNSTGNVVVTRKFTKQ